VSAEHTPIPWVAMAHKDDNKRFQIRGPGEAGSTTYFICSDANAANAAFICRAVNAHAALVEACRGVMEAAENINAWQHSGHSPTMEMWGELYDHARRAKTALALAGGAE
jgi:hypothetical protein